MNVIVYSTWLTQLLYAFVISHVHNIYVHNYMYRPHIQSGIQNTEGYTVY